MTSQPICGLTVWEKLTDLDPALVAEAEVDARYVPSPGGGLTYEQKQARRERRETRREENPFFRFMSSGAGAVCISLLVAFSLIAGIVYAVNHLPGNPVIDPGSRPGGTPGGTEAATWGEGRIPTGELDANYTVHTDRQVYETAPSRIRLTLRGKYPGVEIAYFQSAHIESLTDPDYVVEAFHNDLDEERTEPLGKDEYAELTKEIEINETNRGALPDGIYRIHHMEYDREAGKYRSGAFCDFAVGVAYGELLLSGKTELPAVSVTVADQDPALLDAFFDADRSALSDGKLPYEVTRESLYHITPAGLYEATGVRVFKEAVYSHSFLLHDGKLYDIPSVGGNGFHNAVVCDYDLDGRDDVLYACSWGSGMHRSEVWVFNTATRECHRFLDTSTFSFLDSTLFGGTTTDMVQNDLCVTRTAGAGEAPFFRIVQVITTRGAHGFADLRFTTTRSLFSVELTAGGLPQVRAIQTESPYDPPKAPDTTYPEAAEKPYTITASMRKNETGDRAFLSVKYTAVTPGTGFEPNFNIAIRKLSGAENPEDLELMTTANAVEVLPPEADVYATYTRTYSITNPEALLPGVYRVYALNDQKQCIAYTDVTVEGDAVETEAESQATADVGYHIDSVKMTPMNDGTVELTITYAADEPGVTVWSPSTDFYPEMIGDGPHTEELMITSTEEAIECVMPTEKNGGYAVWSKSHTVENPEALIHGTYRITAITWTGTVIDTYDFQWDGKTATPTGLMPE